MEKTLLMQWIDMLLTKYDLSLFEQFYLDLKTNAFPGRTYQFTTTALQWYNKTIEQWVDDYTTMCAMAFFDGECRIEKIPFCPQLGTIYFYIEWGKDQKPYVTQTTWDNYAIDRYNFYFQNCFQTAEAANKNKNLIYDKIIKATGSMQT